MKLLQQGIDAIHPTFAERRQRAIDKIILFNNINNAYNKFLYGLEILINSNTRTKK